MEYIIIVLSLVNFVGLFMLFKSIRFIDSAIDQRLNHVCLNFVKLEERIFQAIEKIPSQNDCASHLEEIQSEIRRLSHDLKKTNVKSKNSKK